MEVWETEKGRKVESLRVMVRTANLNTGREEEDDERRRGEEEGGRR